MNIVEAIKKAGPGGKIRRPCHQAWAFVYDGAHIQFTLTSPLGYGEITLSQFDGFATDWEARPKRREVWVCLDGVGYLQASTRKEDVCSHTHHNPVRFVEAEE